jgi:hypothetical protein
MKTYFIKEGYQHRLDNQYFDDTENTDKWQREVYTFAKDVAVKNNFTKVIDIGTGSAYKLLDNFRDFETVGIDVPQTVAWLRETYPDRTWVDKFEPITGYDLVIGFNRTVCPSIDSLKHTRQRSIGKNTRWPS